MESQTQTLKEKIEGAATEYLKSKLYSDRWANVRASGIGDICVRRLFYRMTETVVSDDLVRQAYFCEGNDQEPGVKRYLSELGFEVLTPQLTSRWQGISCKPDGIIDGRLLEIKTVSDYAWDGLNEPKDFLESRYHRNWYAQLQIGMLLFDKDRGLFVLKRKAAKQIKVIEVVLDYAYAEGLLKKAEVVNGAVKKGEPPDYLLNNPVECKSCQFFGKTCNPPLDFGEMTVIDDEELAKKLAIREELSGAVSEYNKIDKEVKERLREIPQAICGDYAITGKESVRKHAEQKAREIKTWTVKIERIGVAEKIE